MTMCHSTSAFHRALTEWHRARMQSVSGALQRCPSCNDKAQITLPKTIDAQRERNANNRSLI